MSEEAKLWVRYRREKSDEALNDLCTHYMPFVETVSRSATHTLNYHVTSAEILGAAFIGLRDAITKFDASLQVPFRAYANRRILGAILDDVRNQDQASRLIRKFQRELNKARAALMQQIQRDPTDREIAQHLGISFEEFQVKRAWWFRSTMFADVQFSYENAEGVTVIIEPPSPDADPFDDVIDREAFERCLRVLSKKQADVFRLRFLDDMNMADIGTALGMSESRVCQLVKKHLPTVIEQYQRRFAA